MRLSSDIRAGFSLMEVMVVLVIIGLMSAMVLLNARSPERQLNQAANNLQARLNHASQLALTSGDMTAMGFTRTQWVMYRQDRDEWQETARGKLPSHVTIQLQGEEGAIKLPETPSPVLWFEPVGISSWYELHIQSMEKSRTLHNVGNGRTLQGQAS